MDTEKEQVIPVDFSDPKFQQALVAQVNILGERLKSAEKALVQIQQLVSKNHQILQQVKSALADL